jgi:hypothetical protein
MGFVVDKVALGHIFSEYFGFPCQYGHARAQAVSGWLPTAVAWVCVWTACGVCGGQSGTGAGFLQVVWFPLPIIPSISPSSFFFLIFLNWYSGGWSLIGLLCRPQVIMMMEKLVE